MFNILFVIGGLIAIAIFLGLIAFFKIKQQIPEDNREYMDPLPILMRVSWPVVKLLAFYIEDHLSVEYVEKSKINLQRSGLGYLLLPSQFLALQILSSIVFALISWWAMITFANETGITPFIFACLGFFIPRLDLSDRRKKREVQVIKMLPVYLDFITMSVQAGMNINGAIMQSVDKGPEGPLNVEFQKVLRDIKAGSGRIVALKNMSNRLNIKEVSSLVSSLAQAERSGSSVGQTLRIQSDQRRVERFQRAEKLAMQAPVKLIGPLVLFIFPTTFIILAFPIVTQMIPILNQ